LFSSATWTLKCPWNGLSVNISELFPVGRRCWGCCAREVATYSNVRGSLIATDTCET
jgi:hypothetical protein